MADLIDLVRQQVREEQVHQRAAAVPSQSPQPEKESTRLPETPCSARNGNQRRAAQRSTDVSISSGDAPQAIAGPAVATGGAGEVPAGEPAPHEGAGYHQGPNAGNLAQLPAPPGVADEFRRLLAGLSGNLAPVTLGRKHVFDDFLRGRLVSLLAVGLSVRQAAAALGLSHVAVLKELKRNPELSEVVHSTRFQAQIEPLLVVVRESKRSWRAATWLVSYLTRQIQSRGETPDETCERQRAERRESNRQWTERQAAEQDQERRLREEERLRQFDAEFPTAAQLRREQERRKGAAAKRRAEREAKRGQEGGDGRPGS